MSYGIIRVAKFNSSAVRGIQIHDEREKDKSHSNPDIDFSKTEENYSLKERPNKTYNQVIKERIDNLDLKKAVRKDAVVMCSFVVTSDKDFFNNISLEQEKAYFQKAYNFVKEKYGEQNIISAEVHKDETTPHLHINFIPVTQDNRLSAKSLFDKKSLKQLQDDFYSQVSREFGLDRGGVEEHQKNIDKVTYKKEKVKNELHEIEQIEKETSEKRAVVLDRAKSVDEYYNIKFDGLTADDVKPKKSGFLNIYSETDEAVASRLNQKLKPLYEKSKLAEVLKSEYNKLKQSFENIKNQLQQVTQELNKFKDLFKGLSKEQEMVIFKQIKQFKYENTINDKKLVRSQNMTSQLYK